MVQGAGLYNDSFGDCVVGVHSFLGRYDQRGQTDDLGAGSLFAGVGGRQSDYCVGYGYGVGEIPNQAGSQYAGRVVGCRIGDCF